MRLLKETLTSLRWVESQRFAVELEEMLKAVLLYRRTKDALALKVIEL
jgi:hypothetical protein